jgi:hypothetical protein
MQTQNNIENLKIQLINIFTENDKNKDEDQSKDAYNN